MKRLLTILAAILTLPLLAQDQTSTGAPPPTPTTEVAPAPQPDSPLVAAAKRANRRGRKTPVITNDNLKKAPQGTSSAPPPLKPLPPIEPTPEMVAARAAAAQKQAAQVDAEKARKTEADRQQARGASEDTLYESPDDKSDPAQTERAQQEANQQKPPQL